MIYQTLRLSMIAVIYTAFQAHAQDIVFDVRHTQACLQDATTFSERHTCIGASTETCMEATLAGSSTMGMTTCTYRELEWWDGQLNANYQKLKAQEASEDADSNDLPGYINQVEALLHMQRAWIKHRDLKCTFERAQWGGGTGGGPAEAACLLDETARQAIYLNTMTETY